MIAYQTKRFSMCFGSASDQESAPGGFRPKLATRFNRQQMQGSDLEEAGAGYDHAIKKRYRDFG